MEAGASEDGGGGFALFDGVFGGGGDAFEDVEGLHAGFEGAESEGLFGEGLEGREVGLDGGGMGEGEELVGLELLLLGEGDHVVAEEEEGVEEAGLVGQEFREWCSGDHERTLQRRSGNARGRAGEWGDSAQRRSLVGEGARGGRAVTRRYTAPNTCEDSR